MRCSAKILLWARLPATRYSVFIRLQISVGITSPPPKLRRTWARHSALIEIDCCTAAAAAAAAWQLGHHAGAVVFQSAKCWAALIRHNRILSLNWEPTAPLLPLRPLHQTRVAAAHGQLETSQSLYGRYSTLHGGCRIISTPQTDLYFNNQYTCTTVFYQIHNREREKYRWGPVDRARIRAPLTMKQYFRISWIPSWTISERCLLLWPNIDRIGQLPAIGHWSINRMANNDRRSKRFQSNCCCLINVFFCMTSVMQIACVCVPMWCRCGRISHHPPAWCECAVMLKAAIAYICRKKVETFMLFETLCGVRIYINNNTIYMIIAMHNAQRIYSVCYVFMLTAWCTTSLACNLTALYFLCEFVSCGLLCM